VTGEVDGARLEVRPAGPGDLEAIAATLAAAFDDDPIYNWFIRQDARRIAAMRHFFLDEAREYVEAGSAKRAWVTAARDGVAMWCPPPGGQRSPLTSMLRAVPGFVRDTGLVGAARLAWLIRATEARYPRIPHWYLSVLGVAPLRQGSGVGSALVREVLAACDRERLPAYVESSKERNLPFYERHGFRVVERLDFPLRGPTLWLMWREPR
jgi:ribosomal protein S18 acetylase RimI-like enzyme